MKQLGTFLSPSHGKGTPFGGLTWQHQQSLSRWEMTRINNTTFTVESFAKVGDKTPNYTASCTRD